MTDEEAAKWCETFAKSCWTADAKEALARAVHVLRTAPKVMAALEGIRPFVAEDFPEKVGEIDWNAYPVSFGYAKAYRALLVALGRLLA